MSCIPPRHNCAHYQVCLQVQIVALLAALSLAGLVVVGAAEAAGSGLRGTVVDRATKEPVGLVAVTLDSVRNQYSDKDGVFNFGTVSAGTHVLSFHHISYESSTITVEWPATGGPLVVELAPAQHVTDKIVVTGKQSVQSIPVSAVTITRDEVINTAGNVANDPLRTVQAQPSCAASGIDFLSEMAIRGGDTEEHTVFYDGYRLDHYAHVGGYAGVLYDDMLRSTVLVPGAAPIQYKGTLSGVIVLRPARPDTSFGSFRYDITSMAGGMGRMVGPSLSVQASAKTSFFNLPVYQQAGVRERSFWDVTGRVTFVPGESFSATATVLAASDTEVGNYASAPGAERTVESALAGVDLTWERSLWEFKLRPSYSIFESRDAISWRFDPREHELRDAALYAALARQGKVFGFMLSGEARQVEHKGSGGEHEDTPYAASAEVRLMHRDAVALVLGAGGSKEPWTEKIEPEAYGSVRVSLLDVVNVSGGFRRSHQTPFVFTQRRYFASLPIDAGDLLSQYTPSWQDAPAVRMDQVSVRAALSLPLKFGAEFNGFRREYENLLTWDRDAFPAVSNVHSGGTGHGRGYEIAIRRDDPEFVSFVVAASQARVWKTEGTLTAERIGDFDRPDSWHVAASVRVLDRLRVSVRWTDVRGRPYTLYRDATTPPPTEDVNEERLPRYQRLDFKLVVDVSRGEFDGELFLDLVNFRNNRNHVEMFGIETEPGVFNSVPYGGTKFFPIAGITLRW